MISTTLLELSVPNQVTDNGLSKQLIQHILHLRAEVYTQSTALSDVWYLRSILGTHWFCVIVHRATTHSRGHDCRSAKNMRKHLRSSCGRVLGILEWGCSYFRRVITTWLGAISRCRDVSVFRTAAVHQVNQDFFRKF